MSQVGDRPCTSLGNVTLNVTYSTVTYKVTRECHGVDLCSDDFGDRN